MNMETLLVDKLNVDKKDLEKAVQYQNRSGGRLEKLLVNMGALSEERLPELYATLLNIPVLKSESLQQWDSDIWQESSIQLDLLIENGWFPFEFNGSEYGFAVTDPFNLEIRELLRFYGVSYNLSVIDEDTKTQLQTLFSKQNNTSPSSDQLSNVEEERLKELASEAPTVNLLNNLISKALKANASDMHLEPFLNKYRIRFRIDGVLHDVDFLPEKMRLPIASRIKILSGMDIAEKRKPQDGKIEMKIAAEEFDIRVSALPLNNGESIVMRFLRTQSINYDLEVLGLSQDIQNYIEKDLKTTAGVILLTGPTGSGKTTSLYSFLNAINNKDVKIITLEDPVEYQLDGINQVQVQNDIGFNFAAGLRSIVRQDPDVIMLGEIRDAETAKVAMQSALTGHLVFSTVHTNDAPTAYTRLIDLGTEEFLLNAAITSVIAQRLARKLCEHCTVEDENAEQIFEEYPLLEIASRYNLQLNIKKAKGCNHCNHTGYSGRIALVEYMPCDLEIKKLPKDKNFSVLAKQHCRDLGLRTLLEDGFYKVIQGVTTVDEVIRVAG